MILYSTVNKNITASFSKAVIDGVPPGGGLYMPSMLPKLDKNFYKIHKDSTFTEIAFELSKILLGDEFSDNDLHKIVNESFTFDAPLVEISENSYILELFHGPTLAFKDFGARFMANIMSHITVNGEKKTIVLAATSGDTGSAVARGFYNRDGVEVVLLYPSGKVSKIQEQQLTTIGGNVTALEIDGTFDDCQKLVKEAFAHQNLNKKFSLSSANSINIARLLPQSFYYHYAYCKIENLTYPVVFSVPSGNLGNITAGLFAKEMGLPVNKFIAAVNSNKIIPEYLQTGVYAPTTSVQTISNAMDVGNPSNFDRIFNLYNQSHEKIKSVIFSKSFSDSQTIDAIRSVYLNYNYLIDPHGAVGFLALEEFFKENGQKYTSVILETAHPAKFYDTVASATDTNLPIPESLLSSMKAQKSSIKLKADFNHFYDFLKKYE